MGQRRLAVTRPAARSQRAWGSRPASGDAVVGGTEGASDDAPLSRNDSDTMAMRMAAPPAAMTALSRPGAGFRRRTMSGMLRSGQRGFSLPSYYWLHIAYLEQ